MRHRMGRRLHSPQRRRAPLHPDQETWRRVPMRMPRQQIPLTNWRFRVDTADIENRFKFHPASSPERQRAHEAVRDECRVLAHVLNESLPEGREKALAITNLEQTMFWANAAIARDRASQGA